MAKKNDAAQAAPKAPAFEELLSEAEALAEKMEEGGLDLDGSIRAYEKGVANLRVCAELLRSAEEKVKVLLEKDGAFRLADLDGDDSDDDDEAGEDEDEDE